MIASSRSLDRAISAALASPSASSMSTSSPMRWSMPELGLELGEQDVDPPDVARRPGLGHDEHVERVAGAGDDLDDVAVAPRRVEAVDAHGAHGPAPVELGERGDRDRRARLPWPPARRRPRGRGRRGRRRSRPPSRTCARCWPAWPAPIVGPGVRAPLPPVVGDGPGGSDDAVCPQRGEAVGVESEQLAVDRVVVGAERPAEVLDAPRRLAQHGDGRLHASSGRGRDRRSRRTCPGPGGARRPSSCSAS